MRLYLESFDLFAHVGRSAEPPEETASAQVKKAFETAAKKAWNVHLFGLSSKYTSETHVKREKRLISFSLISFIFLYETC